LQADLHRHFLRRTMPPAGREASRSLLFRVQRTCADILRVALCIRACNVPGQPASISGAQLSPATFPMRRITQQNSATKAADRHHWRGLLAAAILLSMVFPARAQQMVAAPDAQVRTTALSAAGLQDAAWSVLQKGMVAGKASERSDAIAALSSIGPNPRALGMILDRLNDKNAAAREKAVAALDTLQARSAIPQLQAALRDPSPSVSFTAAKALWDMGDASGRDILIGVLQGKRRGAPSAWQSQLQQTTAQLRSPLTLSLLGAQQAVGVFFGPAAIGVAVLGQMLRDHGAPERAFCAEMLGLDPSPEATAALAKAARDKNWMVRASAAAGLGNVARPNGLNVLQGMLRDSKPPVRYMAAASVIRLQAGPAGTGREEAASK
jgi:HEAT repeat protein